MEILEQLEIRIAELLGRLDILRAENAEARQAVSDMAAEKAALEEENRRLRSALESGEELRREALRRLDGLLRKIQAHDSLE